MSWAAAHHRIAVAHARLVAGLRNAVHVGAKRDLRLAGAVAPLGRPRRRHARHALLDGEAFLGQQRGDVALRLEFLEAQLLEREEHIHDLLDLLGAGLDHHERLGLELLETGVNGRGRRRRLGRRGRGLRQQRGGGRRYGGQRREAGDQGTGGAKTRAKAGWMHGGLPRWSANRKTGFVGCPQRTGQHRRATKLRIPRRNRSVGSPV